MRRLGFFTMLAVALLVTACSDDGEPDEAGEARLEPPRELADAETHYGDVRTEVVDALSTGFPEVAWADQPETPMTEQPDGTCQLFLPNALSHDDLYAASDEMAGLAEVLDPVLETHGFGELSGVTQSEHGGDVYVEAGDPTGWELRVDGFPALVRLNGPVDSRGCDDADRPE